MAKNTKRNKHFQVFRKFDIFGVPLKMYFHKHNSETDEYKHEDVYKSYVSGFFSVVVVVLVWHTCRCDFFVRIIISDASVFNFWCTILLNVEISNEVRISPAWTASAHVS